jgi:hypothetical protein
MQAALLWERSTSWQVTEFPKYILMVWGVTKCLGFSLADFQVWSYIALIIELIRDIETLA